MPSCDACSSSPANCSACACACDSGLSQKQIDSYERQISMLNRRIESLEDECRNLRKINMQLVEKTLGEKE